MLAFKVAYPSRVFLLRGANEDAEMLKKSGFVQSLAARGLLEEIFVWLALVDVLKTLPLAALVDDSIFCVHGGPGATMRK